MENKFIKALERGEPQTKTGMTGSKDKIIPEFYLDDLTDIEDGAILKIYDKDGKILEMYELDKQIWRKQW